MFRPLHAGRTLLFAAATLLAACGPEEEGATVLDNDTNDALRDEPEAESRLCAELACPSDQICVVPPLFCDDSGDAPVLRRDDAFCRPISAGEGLIEDPSLDLAAAIIASQLCDDPQPIGPAEDFDAPPLGLRCPDIDVTCEQLERS